MFRPLQWIEATLNRTLAFDARTPQRLETLHGKKLAIKMTGLTLQFLIVFSKTGLRFSADPLDQADILARGPATAFLSLAISKDPFAASRLGLSFEGDTTIAQAMQTFFLDLEIDWEEILSHFTGDVVAHSIFTLTKKAQEQQKVIQENLNLALGDYLKQEIRLLPSQPEVEAFLDEVDDLSQAIERLQARLERLEPLQAGKEMRKEGDSSKIGAAE